MALVNYDIDFKKMVEQLLGALLRKTIRVAWLTACLKPVRNLHDIFLSFSNSIAEEIRWNGQTIVLEQLLIDKFGAGIFITNNVNESNGALVGQNTDTAFFVGAGPDNSNYIDVTYNISDFNFTVHVPGAIVFTQSQMEAYIKKYKLHGTTYNIVIF